MKLTERYYLGWVETQQKCYYFGCVETAGHYIFDEGLIKHHKLQQPWGWDLDGVLQPTNTFKQGICNCHHQEHNWDNWSCIAFWDNSIDHRGKSCSVFLFKNIELSGYSSFEFMKNKAKEIFPGIFKRFKFELTLNIKH